MRNRKPSLLGGPLLSCAPSRDRTIWLGDRLGGGVSKASCGKDWLEKGLQGLQFYACPARDEVPASRPQMTWLA